MSTRLQMTGAALLVAIGAVGLAMSAATAGDLSTGGSALGDAAPSVDGVWLDPDPELLLGAAAEAMAGVESVRFELQRRGEPVFLDPSESLALDHATGRVMVDGGADALLAVVVDGELNTELGAVAIGDEVWLSNPITGVLEPLPASIDIDPRSFFDPAGAWAPLLRDLTGAVLVDSDDDRYLLTAVASGAGLRAVTAGIVDGDDTSIAIWLHPVTAHVTRLEFETGASGGTTSWSVVLGDYGAEFEIVAPVGAGG